MEIKLHTIPEVAQLLGVHRATVYTLIASGRLRVVDIGQGRSKSRIRSDDLNDYIESNTRKAVA